MADATLQKTREQGESSVRGLGFTLQQGREGRYRKNESIWLKVRDIDFDVAPTKVLIDRLRLVFITDELSSLLGKLAAEKVGDDLLLGYKSLREFHADFRRMVRASGTRFDLSDIKELFRGAAGGDYAILKGYKSEESRSPDEIRSAWLKALPKLVVRA